MPAPSIISFTQKSGKSQSEVERLWDKAKKITSDFFNKKEDDFGEKEWSYTTGTLKNMLGLDESTKRFDVVEFIHSNNSARKYMETLTSASFPLGDTNIRPDSERQGSDNFDPKKDDKKDDSLPANEVKQLTPQTSADEEVEVNKKDNKLDSESWDVELQSWNKNKPEITPQTPEEFKKGVDKEVKEYHIKEDLEKDYIAAGTVLQYINARHFGNIKQADLYKAELKKLLGSNFESYLLKFGDPDKGNFHNPNVFKRVQQAWIDEVERIRKESLKVK